MLNYNSIYRDLAGQTLKWLPSDTEERYQINLKTRYNELEKNGWIDSTITYRFNSLGFRCEEFTQDPTAMFLGGSDTIGVGLPVELIWPEIVSKRLNFRCANLGINGGSCDTAFRLCHGYIDKISPKLVVLMTPPIHRIELIRDQVIQNLFPIDANQDQYLKSWWVDDNNSVFNYEKNVLAIKMLCAERNIKLIVVDMDDLRMPCSNSSLARDLLHVGRVEHHLFAGKLLNMIG